MVRRAHSGRSATWPRRAAPTRSSPRQHLLADGVRRRAGGASAPAATSLYSPELGARSSPQCCFATALPSLIFFMSVLSRPTAAAATATPAAAAAAASAAQVRRRGADRTALPHEDRVCPRARERSRQPACRHRRRRRGAARRLRRAPTSARWSPCSTWRVGKGPWKIMEGRGDHGRSWPPCKPSGDRSAEVDGANEITPDHDRASQIASNQARSRKDHGRSRHIWPDHARSGAGLRPPCAPPAAPSRVAPACTARAARDRRERRHDHLPRRHEEAVQARPGGVRRLAAGERASVSQRHAGLRPRGRGLARRYAGADATDLPAKPVEDRPAEAADRHLRSRRLRTSGCVASAQRLAPQDGGCACLDNMRRTGGKPRRRRRRASMWGAWRRTAAAARRLLRAGAARDDAGGGPRGSGGLACSRSATGSARPPMIHRGSARPPSASPPPAVAEA